MPDDDDSMRDSGFRPAMAKGDAILPDPTIAFGVAVAAVATLDSARSSLELVLADQENPENQERKESVQAALDGLQGNLMTIASFLDFNPQEVDVRYMSEVPTAKVPVVRPARRAKTVVSGVPPKVPAIYPPTWEPGMRRAAERKRTVSKVQLSMTGGPLGM